MPVYDSHGKCYDKQASRKCSATYSGFAISKKYHITCMLCFYKYYHHSYEFEISGNLYLQYLEQTWEIGLSNATLVAIN